MTVRLYDLLCFIGIRNDDYKIIQYILFYRKYE